MTKVKSFLKYVPLFALVVSLAFNIQQCFQNKAQRKNYLEKLEPEVDCYYNYYADSNNHELVISNVSLVDAKDVWADEQIFVIINDDVFKGQDIPHYNYFVYEGSRARMWDLDRNEHIQLRQAKYQSLAFHQLKERFYPTIICRWSLSYSSTSTSKRYHIEKYFLYDFQDGLFKEIGINSSYESLLNKVRDYLSLGKRRSINIFDLTGNFEIDSPNSYLIEKDYSIKPLYPWSKVTIKEFNESLLFSPGVYEIQPSDNIEGSICYFWEYQDGKWEKGVFFTGKGPFYSKPIQLSLAYLPRDEEKQVLKNPKLLKYFNENREAPKESVEEIMEKARIKYLQESESSY